tara:strand:- start:843 stop:1022 length:180 start_codon:yes stop_codon:yes gene_type:complete
MNNLNKDILIQNRKLERVNLVYKDALNLAMEGLRNLKVYDNTNISYETMREVNKILKSK